MKPLSELSDAEFKRLVDDDLRVKDPAERSQLLRSPENVDRWYSTLLSMIKSVEGQLAARRVDWDGLRTSLATQIAASKHFPDQEVELRAQLQEEREKYLKWRAGTLRFKTGLDQFLAEARHLRSRTVEKLYEQAVSDERAYLASRVRLLEEGIRHHRDLLLAEDLDDEAHEAADEHLWSLVAE